MSEEQFISAIGEEDKLDDQSKVHFEQAVQEEHPVVVEVVEEESRWNKIIHAFKPLFGPSSQKNAIKRRSTYTHHGMTDSVSIHSAASAPAEEATEEPTTTKRSKSALFRRKSMDADNSINVSVNESRKTKERLKDMMASIKGLKLPKGLLTRRSATVNRPVRTSQVELPPMTELATLPLMKRDVPVILEMIQVKFRELEGSDVDSNAYQIELSYGKFKWNINKTLVDMYKLHSVLRLKAGVRHSNVPSFPSQVDYAIERARAYTRNTQGDLVSRAFQLIRLKNQHRKQLQIYLSELLKRFTNQNCHEIYYFLELSKYSFDFGTTKPLSVKGKEGIVYKRHKRLGNLCMIIPQVQRGRHVWLMVRDSCVVYFEHGVVAGVLLFDADSKFQIIKTLVPFKRNSFAVTNAMSDLVLRVDSDRQYADFTAQIASAIEQSEWSKPHRFNSFAPIRTNIDGKYFVDAEDYFKAVYEAILAAKDTIYIEDWWLTPKLHLLRTQEEFPESRLDLLLLKKAQEGVIINVILYKEFSIALTINSFHSKFTLTSVHPNIRVQRYPDHVPGGVYFWALHDKIVVVDNETAFIGGLDLCLGRFDDSNHAVTDATDKHLRRWHGQDYSNPRIKDFVNVDKDDESLIDRLVTPRMPWHDVHCQLNGAAACDVARHFVQRWNHIKLTKGKERKDHPFLIPPSYAGKSTGTLTTQLIRSSCEWSMGVQREQSIYEAYVQLIGKAQHYIYIENQFFISAAVDSDTEAQSVTSNSGFEIKNKIAKAIVDRIIEAHSKQQIFKVYIVVPLLPAFENEILNGITTRLIFHWHQNTFQSMKNQLLKLNINPDDYLSICSLRGHGAIEKEDGVQQVTEQIYIHSKVMLVDDQYAIIGSANVNDRSQAGNRDAEIGTVIEDSAKIASFMNGREYQAAAFVRNLRLRLFSEHIGMDLEQKGLVDPTCRSFFDLWNHTATKNTQIYHLHFYCVPDNSIKTWDEYLVWMEETSDKPPGHTHSKATREDLVEQLKFIQGNLVAYPIEFMAKEDLAAISLPNPEALMPMDVFT